MNKSDLIIALADKEDLNEKDAKTIINLIFDGFTKALENSGRIEVRGLGSFSVRNYKSYGEGTRRLGEKLM